jgi:DNA-binding NarL/FixJ family response regulator
MRRVAAETTEPLRRAGLLDAYVEIMLSAGHIEEAREACEEFHRIAQRYRSSMLEAMAARAKGAVHLADGDAWAALVALRNACRLWQELGVPYDAARARLLLARACREIGDMETAEMELDAARDVFRELGATHDVALAERLPTTRGDDAGLTPRELQVLGLVATGKTNRAIADALVISEKTVARHVSNIFVKVGVSTRAAATAYAYEHDLV